MRWRILLAVILVIAGATAGVVAWFRWALTRPGPAVGLELVVDEGEPAGRILEDLHELGLLPSPLAGRLYLRLFAVGRSPHFGHYRVPPSSQPVDVLESLLKGVVEVAVVTIIEGTEADEVASIMASAEVGSASEWRLVLTRGDLVRDVAPGATSLEGFLFPDTYRFSPGTTAEQAARRLLERFREVFGQEVARVTAPPSPVLRVVTLASLVEAETSVAEERPRIAGVFANRLRLGMPLQCDPTVVFALKRRLQWTGVLTREHWLLDDPYNTYRFAGLPPGPINSPGRASLAAALSPEPGPFLYFVASPGGGHTFSVSLEEHNRAAARLQRTRR